MYILVKNQCVNDTKASHVSHATLNTIQTNITVAPQIAPFEITEKPANSGDSVSVVCAIMKGDLPMEITWSVDGVSIQEKHPDINVLATTKKNSILSIEFVAARHAGIYTCSASNKAGAASHSSILKVNGTCD